MTRLFPTLLLIPALSWAATPAQQAQLNQMIQATTSTTEQDVRPAFSVRSYTLAPANGYPGTTATLTLHSTYDETDLSGQHDLPTVTATVDWGDGSAKDTVLPGASVTHTYGVRASDGSLTPATDTLIHGTVTVQAISTAPGSPVLTLVEPFSYQIWVDAPGAQNGDVEGRRMMPDTPQPAGSPSLPAGGAIPVNTPALLPPP